jgi:hypothetical protein
MEKRFSHSLINFLLQRGEIQKCGLDGQSPETAFLSPQYDFELMDVEFVVPL